MTSLLSLITPINLSQEKEKFLSSHRYNPIFHYNWQDNEPKILPKNTTRLMLYQSVLRQDHQSITANAKELFLTNIEPKIIASAKTDINNQKDITHSGSAKDFASLLKEAFELFNIDYTIEITQNGGFNARPDHKHKKLLISSAIKYEMFSMQGGVRHDLTHITRYLNGVYNNIKRSKNYLPTEEGLASYCQDNVVGIKDNGVVQHAIEYLASSVGVNGSLRDIYEVMRDCGMSQELAYQRAIRHKFGFVDTSQSGDIIKPAMYYYNELKVKNLSTSDKLRLFVGKIGLDQISDYREYTGIWPKELLVNYFNL